VISSARATNRTGRAAWPSGAAAQGTSPTPWASPPAQLRWRRPVAEAAVITGASGLVARMQKAW